jgi:peptidoglycan hydrolase-like protein with peptidoglycan-binding domain
MRKIQELMISRGLLHSLADGEFGSSTRIAIRQFQESVGAPQTGFLSHEQISQLRVSQLPQAPLPPSAEGPSFNCAKAIYPDEFAICSNAELSRLDIVADAGFEYVRRVFGHQLANSITLPLARTAGLCG